MQIIPSIDIADGTCVRLLKGDYGEKTVYAARPLEMAEKFIRSGARALHVVDLDGARVGRITNWEVIAELAALGGIEVQVGGGIRTEADIDRLLRLGARRLVIGSVAITSGESVKRWAKVYGPEQFCVALDMRDGTLTYHGWLRETQDGLASVVAEMTQCGIGRYLSTDIRKDGTLEGPNVDLYSSLVSQFPHLQWFASGGVGSAHDVRALKRTGVSGAIVGKALYEEHVRLEDLLEAAC